MKRLLFLSLLLLTWPSLGQVDLTGEYLLKGKVISSNQQPVENAFVRVAKSFNEVSTDENGYFEIQVVGEDVLIIDAMSMYMKNVDVDFKEKLDIVLAPKYEPLGEVEIKQKKKEFKEKNVPGGSAVRRALGYDGDRFRESFVNESDFDIRTSLANMPGLELRMDHSSQNLDLVGGDRFLFFQRYKPLPAHIVVDGMLVLPSYILGLRAEEIENVMLIDDASMPTASIAGVGEFKGYAGYIVIDTIYGKMGDWDEGPPSMLATENDYSGDAKILEAEMPGYILELETASTFEEAKSIRQQQLDAMQFASLAYQLNTADYFRKWDPEYAATILSGIYEMGKSNPRVLLGLAYHYEASGEQGKATYIYQDLLTLQPDDIQAYRNLALMYAQSGKFELANTLYRKMLFNEVPKVDFTPLAELIRNEYRNFIAHHKARIDYSGLPSDMLQANFKKDMRMVFEWNNPFAAFELQMVSPEGKFYTWKHTQEDNRDILKSEVEHGYAIKEFIIDDSDEGEWLVNINVLNSDNESIPTYLKYTLYTNYGKQDEARKMKVVNLNTLDTKVTLDNVMQQGDEDVLAMRENPEQLLLYWDTSLGMMNRNVDKEMRLLSDYVRRLTSKGTPLDITLVLFGRDMKENKRFELSYLNFSELEDTLRQVTYHGPTDFTGVFNETDINADAALVFSDATSIYSMPETQLNIPIFCINSLPDANHMILNDLAFYSGGFYVDLSRKSVEVGLENLLKDIYVNEDYASVKEMNQVDNLVYGVVHNESGPIQGARVGIRGSFNQVTTGSNGMYRIAASQGEILQVKSFGMKTRDLTVGAEKKMHVKMEPDGELLEEVTVTGKKSEAEIVDTPFENKKKGSVGYSLSNRVTADQIGAYQTDLFQVLQKMPGVIVVGQTTGNPRYKLRRTQNNSLRGDNYPAFVLDGMVVDQATQQVPFINPQQIKSITILQSANAAIRYGQLAANGAIVVETISAADIADNVPEATLDPVRGNDYTDNLLSVEDLLDRETVPTYIRAIKESPDFESAKNIYFEALKSQEEKTISFFTMAAEAMRTKNREFAINILYNIAEIAPENVQALKTLTFYLESFEADVLATPVYERLVNLDPRSAQSYLDLARNYKVTGAYDLSATLYKQMVANNIPNVDFTEVAVTVFNEFKQLVALHKSRIDFSNIPEPILRVGFKKDIRIVVEWNEPLVDFDLQFVSPRKKYFQISHSVFGDKEQIKTEIKNGIYIKEFEVEDAEKGEWLVNIKYNGESEALNPSVLKYTMYRNYGLPTEERVVKAIRLADLPEKASLDSFNY